VHGVLDAHTLRLARGVPVKGSLDLLG
jgi:hypothetical protein